MITAFNFTCTKYDSKSCRTFHFMSEDTSQLNEYKKCIMSIGSVLTNYMTNKKYAVYGFGVKMNKKINHCFPLTFNTEKTEVNSLQDIIDTYNQAIKKVSFSQSTHFAEMIKEAIKISVKKYHESHTYSILFILTDCSNNDMQNTVKEIIKALDAPLSIVIIGFGDTDYKNIHKLDVCNHSVKLISGKLIKREIVQFAHYNGSSETLENNVLEKIPLQIYQFCSSHGFIPEMQKNDYCCFL